MEKTTVWEMKCKSCGKLFTAVRPKKTVTNQLQQGCPYCHKTHFYNKDGSYPAVWDATNGSPTNSSDITEIKLVQQYDGSYLPTKSDFEAAYRKLSGLGGELSLDTVLEQIEINAISSKLTLKNNWRLIIENNFESWTRGS